MKTENHFQGEVLDYVRERIAVDDPILRDARRRAEAAGLPMIEVAPEDGALLAAVVTAIGAVRVVEVGTLFGYSAIWIGRALPPEGRLYTIESEPDHAELARANLAAAGLTDRVEVLVGRALDVLPAIDPPLDLVFVDADKVGYPDYLRWSKRLLRPGGVLLADNAFMQGRVADPHDRDEAVEGMRRFLEELSGDSAWTPAILPTLEGMAMGVKR